MTREEAREELITFIGTFECPSLEAVEVAIEALKAEAVQGCDGCRYNTRTPKEQCLRCKRYWRDSYERKE